MVNVSLNKRTFTIDEVLTVYENLEPISPFAIQSVDVKNKINDTFNKSNYNNEVFIKKNKKMYTIIVICIIIIFILKVINRKSYYDY